MVGWFSKLILKLRSKNKVKQLNKYYYFIEGHLKLFINSLLF